MTSLERGVWRRGQPRSHWSRDETSEDLRTQPPSLSRQHLPRQQSILSVYEWRNSSGKVVDHLAKKCPVAVQRLLCLLNAVLHLAVGRLHSLPAPSQFSCRVLQGSFAGDLRLQPPVRIFGVPDLDRPSQRVHIRTLAIPHSRRVHTLSESRCV